MKSDWLVSVDWLAGKLNDPTVIPLDVRLREENASGHIPGSVFVPEFYDTFVDTGERGLAQFQSELTNWIRRAGIERDDTIVCYENATGMRCTRAAWMLAYAGHPNAFVLDGGFVKWNALGHPVNLEIGPPRPPTNFDPVFDSSLIATRDDTHRACTRDDSIIVDCRERDEFLGTDEFDCCPRRGRVPSAIWFYWRRLLQVDDASFLPDAKMRQVLIDAGITPEKEVIIYCHRGARAANTWMALEHLGYPDVKNYIGSWHEWSARPELPIESGEVTKSGE